MNLQFVVVVVVVVVDEVSSSPHPFGPHSLTNRGLKPPGSWDTAHAQHRNLDLKGRPSSCVSRCPAAVAYHCFQRSILFFLSYAKNWVWKMSGRLHTGTEISRDLRHL